MMKRESGLFGLLMLLSIGTLPGCGGGAAAAGPFGDTADAANDTALVDDTSSAVDPGEAWLDAWQPDDSGPDASDQTSDDLTDTAPEVAQDLPGEVLPEDVDGQEPGLEDTGASDEGDAGLPDDTTDTVQPADLPAETPELPPNCREFVYLDDGRFLLEGRPYGLQGTNFSLGIGARLLNADTPNLQPEDYEFEYFLAPHHAYFPDNNGVCWDDTIPAGQCCSTADECRDMIRSEHIARIQDLGANSVRVVGLGIKYDAQGAFIPCYRVTDPYVPRDNAANWKCRLNMFTAPGEAVGIGIVREAIRLLGEAGIRTILLTGDGDQELAAYHADYVAYLSRLAAALKHEPDLIAYDPFNEPPYAYSVDQDSAAFDVCGEEGFCKAAAQKVSKAWFDALTGADSNHLVTIGLGTTRDLYWDPFILYDHFSSYHIYPWTPWSEPDAMHGKVEMEVQLYRAAMGACGLACPFVGEYDGLECRVAVGPIGAEGWIWSDGFYYTPIGDPPDCPIGWADPNCKVGSFVVGRDTPVMRDQPWFFVLPQGKDCPIGTTLQDNLCLVGFAPPDTTGFMYTAQDGIARFYHTYSGVEAGRCPAPAIDDSANCVVAPVPAGYTPLILTRPVYAVQAVTCGPRKPMIFGETGLNTFPNGLDLDPAHYVLNDLQMGLLRDGCVDGGGHVIEANRPMGNEADQVAFLLGDPAIPFKGMYDMSLDCGFQGLHWWTFSSVHYGGCGGDHFGLYTYWYATQAEPAEDDPEALVPRLVATRFSELDYRMIPTDKCTVPAGFNEVLTRIIGTPHEDLYRPRRGYQRNARAVCVRVLLGYQLADLLDLCQGRRQLLAAARPHTGAHRGHPLRIRERGEMGGYVAEPRGLRAAEGAEVVDADRGPAYPLDAAGGLLGRRAMESLAGMIGFFGVRDRWRCGWNPWHCSWWASPASFCWGPWVRWCSGAPTCRTSSGSSGLASSWALCRVWFRVTP